MWSRVSEVLDKVDKDQGAAGSVKHRDLAHDACALHEHLVDFTDPLRRCSITKNAIIFQAGIPSLDTGTDPCLRSWKGGFRGGCIHVVEISRRDYVGNLTQRRDFFGDRRSNIAWRVQHKLARGKTDRCHSCLEPRSR